MQAYISEIATEEQQALGMSLVYIANRDSFMVHLWTKHVLLVAITSFGSCICTGWHDVGSWFSDRSSYWRLLSTSMHRQSFSCLKSPKKIDYKQNGLPDLYLGCSRHLVTLASSLLVLFLMSMFLNGETMILLRF